MGKNFYSFIFILGFSIFFLNGCGNSNGTTSSNFNSIVKLNSNTPIGNILFESGVPKTQRDALAESIQSLEQIRIENPSSELLEMLHKNNTISSRELLDWLESRVRYIISENFALNSNITVQNTNYAYANPGVFPPVETAASILEARDAKVIMLNIGAMLYLAGKQQNILLSLQIPGIGNVPVTSPRVGILKIGEGMFTEFPENLPNAMHIFRLGTLFHEARHSDGNGTSLVFLHALCPEGHDYANINACDRNDNGPYSLGAVLARNLLKGCANCSQQEQQTVKLMVLDWMGRVLPSDTARIWDDSPEGSR